MTDNEHHEWIIRRFRSHGRVMNALGWVGGLAVGFIVRGWF